MEKKLADTKLEVMRFIEEDETVESLQGELYGALGQCIYLVYNVDMGNRAVEWAGEAVRQLSEAGPP